MRLPMFSVFVLAPLLAACGGDAEEASEQFNQTADADMAAPMAADDGDAASDTATVAEGETATDGTPETPAATATPTPTPSASLSLIHI